jgi:hypothetical protein
LRQRDGIIKDKIQQVLTEIRVALPGAQALLGFQFTSLFMEAFQKLPGSFDNHSLDDSRILSRQGILYGLWFGYPVQQQGA